MDKATEALAAVTGQALGSLKLGPAAEWLAATGPQLARFNQQAAIEEAIRAFAPEADEAQEILDALTAALLRRYDDRVEKAIGHADQFRAALGRVAL